MNTSIALLFLTLFAQDIGANLTGVARDQSGAVLPGVTVTAADVGTEIKRSVITSETGQYVLRNLSPAEHRIASIGTERQSDIIRVWNHVELTDSIYQVKGKHSLSYGVNYKRIQVNGLQGFARFGQFFFQDLSTFLQGVSSTMDVALPESNLSRGYRMWLWSGFLQDDWTFSRKLVLNGGRRYDFVSVPTEAHGLISNLPAAFLDGGGPDTRVAENANFVVGGKFYKNPSKASFGPRLGFAWDVVGNGKMSVRGGGGVFYAPILPANFQVGGFSSPPFTFRLNIPNPIFPTGWINQDVTELKKNLLVQPMDPEPGQPVLYRHNLTVQPEVMPDLVVSLGYAGSRGVPSPAFGRIGGTATTSRQIQLALRLTF